MAMIQIDIPDAVAPRVLDAFDAQYYGRQQLDPVPTKAQWAKRKVAEFVKDVVRGYEANKDAEIARQAAIIKADAEITVT